MRTEHTESYYAATRHDRNDRPALKDNIDTDVCIIGGGYTGISSALHLAEAGFKVVVLEAARLGFGASGRNGGQLVNSYSRDIDVIERNYGKTTGHSFGAMAFEGADIIRERVKKYNIDCDLKPGGIFAALNAKQMHELTEQKKLWERYGHTELELLDSNAVQKEINTDVYEGALLDHKGGHMHPLNLLLGEVAAFEQLGGVVYEDSAALKIERTRRPKIHTAEGSVTADYLLVAGNAYMHGLVPELSAKTMPCGTQIITTEVLEESVASTLIPNGYCVEDCNYKLDYYRITGDNRLLFGGGVTYGGGDPNSIEHFLRRHLERTFPQLKGIKFDYAWGGDFLLTMSRLPQFGRLNDSIYYAQGYSGHGVTTTHLAGKVIAEALKGDATRFDTFASLKHLPFPGGRIFRVPYTAIGAFYYGLRDKLGI
ncbi:gamma-glutamylputrescine oxidoreductase [Oleiphilus sp. HI0009]|nr:MULTISPECIES: FAD-binding oxidoreductase [unclassified Oleiphilus]KZX83141.1 gamma-glutamylputrescine oxidoreductase [Oleiphilus sp. HI0009]KZY65338.1 gamma-glutamylputrescine oxidoreductase [Oleiphilus sp. HI0066]KZY68441.1 gamma-glutamylputrescine oxidoreductase [Oleiphilus sp. HI0067]KZZ59037.1 gamma-glutamylputrescine oxidoreductase [Oleiphilus sp. HI0125]